MALDLTGISNENEFYTHHYLAAILETDLKGFFGKWEDREAQSGVKPPYDHLARLCRLEEVAVAQGGHFLGVLTGGQERVDKADHQDDQD